MATSRETDTVKWTVAIKALARLLTLSRITKANRIRKHSHRGNELVSSGTTTSTNSNLKRWSKAKAQAVSHLSTLPDEILIAIFGYLRFPEFIALSHVSSRFYLASSSKILWHGLASDVERQGLNLVLDLFGNIQSLSLPALKQVVIRTLALRETWSSNSPSKFLKHYTVPFPDDVRSRHSRGDWICLTENYLVVSMGYGQLMGASRKTGKCIGKYSPPDESYSHDQSWCGRAAYLVYVIPGINDMEYQIVKMQFPEEDERDDEEIRFTNIASVPLTYARELVKVVLDAKKKRMAISSMGDGMQSSSSVQVLIVLDWSVEPIQAVNIDLKREYEQGTTSFDVFFSPDGDHFLVYSEEDGHWEHKSFSIADLQRHSMPVSLIDYTNPIDVDPVHQTESELLPCSDLPLERSTYNTHSWSAHVPIEHRRYKDALLVISASLYRENPTVTSRWMLMHYVSLRDRPLTRKRTIIRMENPVMAMHGEPLIGLGYNYSCWIEKVKTKSVKLIGRRRDSNTEKYELRIAAYPRIDLDSVDSGEPSSSSSSSKSEDDGNCSIKTLDIPQDILRSARRITVHELRASIVIWTWSFEMHCYEYA